MRFCLTLTAHSFFQNTPRFLAPAAGGQGTLQPALLSILLDVYRLVPVPVFGRSTCGSPYIFTKVSNQHAILLTRTLYSVAVNLPWTVVACVLCRYSVPYGVYHS